MHVFSKYLPREGGRSICLIVCNFFDGLVIFRILEEVQEKHERFGYIQKFLKVKRTVPWFQLSINLISYLQNESGLLSIQQENEEIMYKNFTNTVNTGQIKHKKGYSRRATGIFILMQRNVALLSLSNFV